MRTRPRELPEEDLRAALSAAWALDAPSIAYRPVGFGSHHWTVVASGGRWFLTVDDLDMKLRSRQEPRSAALVRLRAALRTARDLADRGLRFVVAPSRSIDGDVVVMLGKRFAAALYPHVEGARGGESGDVRSPAERQAVLDLVVEVHAAGSSHARTDDLTTPMLPELLAAVEDVGRPWSSGPYAERARALLGRHVEGLVRMLAQQQRWAGEALADPDRFVLTHGEPHPGNTMTTPQGLVLVDWDTALLAPPERDLWIVAGDDGRTFEAYAAATGRAVREDVVTCYRLSWDVAEIAGYVALLRDEHADTADVAESWRNLQHFLDPPRRWPALLAG